MGSKRLWECELSTRAKLSWRSGSSSAPQAYNSPKTIKVHLDGAVLTQWFAPETETEERQLKRQIYKSLANQSKMPLAEDDFMDACTYAGDGVFVYTLPPDLDNIHVCLAKRGLPSSADHCRRFRSVGIGCSELSAKFGRLRRPRQGAAQRQGRRDLLPLQLGNAADEKQQGPRAALPRRPGADGPSTRSLRRHGRRRVRGDPRKPSVF